MSPLKTVISEADARTFLDDRWGTIGAFTRLPGGESTQAFSVELGEQPVVLRINGSHSYEKDAAVTRRFADAAVAVPEVLATGTRADYHWSVSRAARGRPLTEMQPEAVQRLVPDIAQMLGTVHTIDIIGTHGYGNFDHTGRGEFATWRDHIRNHDALVDWQHFFAIAPMDISDLVRAACDQVDRLVALCPEHRHLNHGDISLDNLFGDDEQVTGVIDWSDARLGDPLWDVARAEFWLPGLGIADAYTDRWGSRPEIGSRTAERLLCYQLVVAANAMGFFVHTQQEQRLATIPARSRALIAQAESVDVPTLVQIG